jgi:hypothetical protein
MYSLFLSRQNINDGDSSDRTTDQGLSCHGILIQSNSLLHVNVIILSRQTCHDEVMDVFISALFRDNQILFFSVSENSASLD